MDILFLIGTLGMFGIIGGTALIKGVPLVGLVGPNAVSAMIIVFGGLAMSMMVGYSQADIIRSIKFLLTVLKGQKQKPEELIASIENFAQIARKDGVLALENELDNADPFLKKALRMLVDNTEPDVIKQTLENQAEAQAHEIEQVAKFWEDAGAFAPAIGITGAVLGLMVVMLNLDDQSKIGPGIFTAFIATLYGVSFANFFALPLSKKIKSLNHHEEKIAEIKILSILGISNGLTPRLLSLQLRALVGLEEEG